MTHERQKWWDSLPAEEKYIRKLIKHLEDDKKRHKANIGFNPLGNLWRLCVKDDKMTIKLLRKQIAMCPQINHLSDVLTRQPQLKCPCCSHRFILHTPYCNRCGQKLRWQE